MKYFSLSEFDSSDHPGSGTNMDERFLAMLDNAREIYGRPMRINSGYRTIYKNQSINGKPNSTHLQGIAADVHCTTSRDRHDMVKAFLQAGFSRIGIADTFIHVDSGDIHSDKDPNVIWTY